MRPPANMTLAIDNKEFFNEVFSVDKFLQKNKSASLTDIRNDLGLYLKLFKEELIQLINQDYTDFINLSGNLKGLEQFIKNISVPLIALKNEVHRLKLTLSENCMQLKTCFEKKAQLKNYRNALINLKHFLATIDYEKNKSTDKQLTPLHLERLSITSVLLKYNKSFCDIYLTDHEKGQLVEFEKQFTGLLQSYFIENLENNNDNIKCCLRIYLSLNACSDAEEIYRKNIVRPYITKALTNTTKKPIDNISLIYNKILDFISLHMKELLIITYYTNEIKGYNFLLKSFWYEVVSLCETYMSSVNLSGNPNEFYQNYQATYAFIGRIETLMKSKEDIISFRQNAETKKFEENWNPSVYFQIRFLEISTKLETICENTIRQINDENISKDNFKIQFLSSALNSINECYSNGIYIQKLFPKYLKFTFQIVARANDLTLQVLELILKKQDNLELRLIFLVNVYNELSDFLDYIPKIVSKVTNKSSLISIDEKILFDKCINDMNQSITDLQNRVEKSIIINLVMSSSPYISNVADVSRLYRKTNRGIPQKHSTYVKNMLETVELIEKILANKLNANTFRNITEAFFVEITNLYYNAIDEALASVKKTEKSLKRLKNIRGNFDTDTTAFVSDDDKIRLQFEVDIRYWTSEIQKRGFQLNDIKMLNELHQLIEASKVESS